MSKMLLKKIEQGVCPYCGSTFLDYDAVEFEDDMLYYPVTCEDCKLEFEEWYNLSFVGHNVGNGCDIVTNAGDENVMIEMDY